MEFRFAWRVEKGASRFSHINRLKEQKDANTVFNVFSASDRPSRTLAVIDLYVNFFIP